MDMAGVLEHEVDLVASQDLGTPAVLNSADYTDIMISTPEDLANLSMVIDSVFGTDNLIADTPECWNLLAAVNRSNDNGDLSEPELPPLLPVVIKPVDNRKKLVSC